MQNLWLKKCSCEKSVVEFRSRKDLYVDSVRQLYCPKCINLAKEGTLVLDVRKWGSTTSKNSDIGLYGILYNTEAIIARNEGLVWSEKEAIETFETGMVRPNLLSTIREDQDYHILGLLKEGEDIEMMKTRAKNFRKAKKARKSEKVSEPKPVKESAGQVASVEPSPLVAVNKNLANQIAGENKVDSNIENPEQKMLESEDTLPKPSQSKTKTVENPVLDSVPGDNNQDEITEVFEPVAQVANEEHHLPEVSTSDSNLDSNEPVLSGQRSTGDTKDMDDSIADIESSLKEEIAGAAGEEITGDIEIKEAVDEPADHTTDSTDTPTEEVRVENMENLNAPIQTDLPTPNETVGDSKVGDEATVVQKDKLTD